VNAPQGRRAEAQAPAQRVVLLGASNLTKALGAVLGTAELALGGPLEVLAALGHGRSYGRATQVLAVGLPGISTCGLWRDLMAAPPLPTAALVTDIGNDLIYGEPVERIVRWVEACLDRLAAVEARTAITLLPVDNLRTLSPVRFQMFRRLLFPFSRISQAEITRRAFALNDAVRRLAVERRLTCIAQQTSWYGLDPIHIRFVRRKGAWCEILGALGSSEGMLRPAGHAIARSLLLRMRAPHERRLLGVAQRGRKPTMRLASGTTVSIY
jgi:hypothetical protein